MRGLFWLFFVVVFTFSFGAHAQTMYVTDSFKITFRTGPGTDHRVLAMLDSGEKLELLERDKDWSKVALQDGKVGYVLTRFLTPEPPSRIELMAIKREYEDLKEKASLPVLKLNKLEKENEDLSIELATVKQKYHELKKVHENLKNESQEFLTLKAEHAKVTEQMVERSKQLNMMGEELRSLRLYQGIKWFLAGAGVLLVGFMIGLSVNRRQRQRSSLLD